MTNIAMVKPWPIEIDGLPINSMVIFHGYVKSPDGSSFGIIIYQSNTKYIYIYICIIVVHLEILRHHLQLQKLVNKTRVMLKPTDQTSHEHHADRAAEIRRCRTGH